MVEVEFGNFNYGPTETPTTKTSMSLPELLNEHDQGDLLCGIAEAVLQLFMEVDVDGIIGVDRHKRSGDRTTWRNGY